MFELKLEIKDGYKNFKGDDINIIEAEMLEFIVNTKTYDNNDYSKFTIYVKENKVYMIEGKFKEIWKQMELALDLLKNVKNAIS